jgi:hypothetical protein
MIGNGTPLEKQGCRFHFRACRKIFLWLPGEAGVKLVNAARGEAINVE